MSRHFYSIAALSFFIVLGGCSSGADTVTYSESYRSQFHFTPAQNWMNDPNGLVYHNGEYHLFYQYNPFGNTWGHMSWGHAVSEDLVHWQHLPVALHEEQGVMVFSGSAVVDHQNTSGFGSIGNPPMVAIYTGHQEGVRQDQRIAYSLDNGRTWTKYQKNPVIDEGMADFRDPKVIWHEPSEQWVMAVALSKQQKIRFYGSKNLKEWELLSEFGPAGAHADLLWECPDLFELSVDGDPENTKWILQVDVNPGAVAGGSGGQYFIGEFDGRTFRQDPATQGETLWVDYGRDFYAAQSYSNIPADDGRRLWLAWMSNWDYAGAIPTVSWRSAMSIPREVGLVTTPDGYRLAQTPVRELQQLRTEHLRQKDIALRESREDWKPNFSGKAFEMIVEFEQRNAKRFGVKLRKGEDEETILGYDAEEQYLFLNRKTSGKTDFDSTFASLEQVPLSLKDGKLELHVFVDWSSVEVFSNGGTKVITDRIFPSPESEGVTFYSEGGRANIAALDIWKLRSVWLQSKNKN